MISVQPILLYYLAGLTIALVAGGVIYYVVGYAITPLLRVLLGEQGGKMGGRLFRMSVVMVALVGALTTKFYGCQGPTDYADVARSHHRMLERTSEQVSGSLHDSFQYLLLAAAVGGIAFAIRQIWRARPS
jgi:hypothetical protein